MADKKLQEQLAVLEAINDVLSLPVTADPNNSKTIQTQYNLAIALAESNQGPIITETIWADLFKRLHEKYNDFPSDSNEAADANVQFQKQNLATLQKAISEVQGEVQEEIHATKARIALENTDDNDVNEGQATDMMASRAHRSPTSTAPDSDTASLTLSSSEDDDEEDQELSAALKNEGGSALMARVPGLNRRASPAADATDAGSSSSASPVEDPKQQLLDDVAREHNRIASKIADEYDIDKGEIKSTRDEFIEMNKEGKLASEQQALLELRNKFSIAANSFSQRNQQLAFLMEALAQPNYPIDSATDQFREAKSRLAESEKAADEARGEYLNAIRAAMSSPAQDRSVTQSQQTTHGVDVTQPTVDTFKTYEEVYDAINAILPSIADDTTKLTDQTLAELDAIQKSLAPVFRSEFVENNTNYDALKTSPEYAALSALSTTVSTRIGSYQYHANRAENIQGAKADIREILNVDKIEAKVDAAKNPKPARPAKPGKNAPPNKPPKPRKPVAQALSAELKAAFKALEDENAQLTSFVQDKITKDEQEVNALVRGCEEAMADAETALRKAEIAGLDIEEDIIDSISSKNDAVVSRFQEHLEKTRALGGSLSELLEENEQTIEIMRSKIGTEQLDEEAMIDTIAFTTQTSTPLRHELISDYNMSKENATKAMSGLIRDFKNVTAKINDDIAARQAATPPHGPERLKPRGDREGSKARSRLVINAERAGAQDGSALQAGISSTSVLEEEAKPRKKSPREILDEEDSLDIQAILDDDDTDSENDFLLGTNQQVTKSDYLQDINRLLDWVSAQEQARLELFDPNAPSLNAFLQAEEDLYAAAEALKDKEGVDDDNQIALGQGQFQNFATLSVLLHAVENVHASFRRAVEQWGDDQVATEKLETLKNDLVDVRNGADDPDVTLEILHGSVNALYTAYQTQLPHENRQPLALLKEMASMTRDLNVFSAGLNGLAQGKPLAHRGTRHRSISPVQPARDDESVDSNTPLSSHSSDASSSDGIEETAKPQEPIQTFFDVQDDKKLARSVYRQNIDALNGLLSQSDDNVITAFVSKVFDSNHRANEKVVAFDQIFVGQANTGFKQHRDSEFYFVVDSVAKDASMDTPVDSGDDRDFLQDLRQKYIQAYTNNKSADNKQNTESTQRYRDISKNDNPFVWTNSKEQARERTQAKHVYLANQLLAADSELPKDNFPVSMQTELVGEKAAHVTLRKDYEQKHDLVKVYGNAIKDNDDLMTAFNELKVQVKSADGSKTYYLLATNVNQRANLDFYLREVGQGVKPEDDYAKGKDKMVTTADLKATWKYEPSAGTALEQEIRLSTFVQEQIVGLTKDRGYTCTQGVVESDAELAKEVAKRNHKP